jgi:hypothetical protein
MKLRFVEFDELKQNTWNKYLQLSNCNLNYQWYFINYQIISFNLINLSGIVFKNEDPIALYVAYADSLKTQVSPLSLSPLVFTKNANDILNANEYYSGIIGDLIFVEDHIFKNDKPISWCPENKTQDLDLNFSSNVRELVIELNTPETILLKKMSRNHRRTIQNSQMKGQRIIEISSSSPNGEISEYFNDYRDTHKLVSGRQTRPDSSFEFMEELILFGISTMFVSVFQNSPVSYLYCDAHDDLSRGWSQVTKPNLEKGLFPRTLLEWSAIKFFKNEGRSIYHLGTIRSKNLLSSHEIAGFDEYKRRFGPTFIT